MASHHQQASKAPNQNVNFLEPWQMGALVLAGGMGAALNYALYPHLEEHFTLPFDKVLEDMGYVANSLQVIKTFLTVILGALGGILLLFMAVVLRTMAVRFLLAYNGWFLRPKHPINKVWYLLMLALLGKKIKKVGNYQEFLPSLPLPPLKATLKKYLTTVKPLLTPEEYKTTEKAVKRFSKEGGWKLQLLLKLKSWTSRNWIKDWWIDFIYLRQRTPIPFNSNYFALGNPKNPTPHGWDRAATLTYYFAKYRYELIEQKEENLMGGKLVPMCSANLKHLHCTARIPEVDQDRVVCYCNGRQNPTHSIILRRGKFFLVEMLNSKTGCLLSPKLLKAQIDKILELAGDEESESCVAAFTALPRTKWAEVRKRLEESPVNRRILKLIDSALTLTVLQSDPVDSTDLTAISQMLFHGNVNNRWFDKCVQLIVCPNGTMGANVEHSSLDATNCGQIWEYVLTSERYDKRGHVIDLPNEDKEVEYVPPSELRWELDGFQTDLKEARENLQGMIADSQLLSVSPSYGKRIPKKCGLSPDGWFQMAMQLTYYRLYKKFVLTYESATTRLYYEGRTETIRPVSDDSVAFVKSFNDPSVPRDEVKKMLKKAIEAQFKYKMEAMRGMGVDRHLFGLYIVAKGLKLDPMPSLFTDKAFNFSFLLSTSQTPVKYTSRWNLETSSCFGGFGTVCDEGYGVSYIIYGEDQVNFSIHSKRNCPDTDSEMFGKALVKAFKDMRALYDV